MTVKIMSEIQESSYGFITTGNPILGISGKIAEKLTLHISDGAKMVAKIDAPDSSDMPYLVSDENGPVARFVQKEDAEIFARIVARGKWAGSR